MLLKSSDVLENEFAIKSQVKLWHDQSAPKLLLLLLLLLLKDHQDIKSRDQDTKTRQGGGLLCLLAWMDLARMDLACLDAMLGLDRKIQFRIVKDTPRCDKSNIINRNPIYSSIHICATSIHIHEKEKHFQISYSKNIFQEILFIFSFHFWSNQSTSREDDTGGFLFSRFSRKQHATVQQYQVFNAWMVP